MQISAELTQALEFACKTLTANSSGELFLPARKRIWSAMGPREVHGSRALIGPGLERRTRLAIMTVRHVQPIWEQTFPMNREPQRILMAAEDYLRQTIDFQTVWTLKNQFWRDLDRLAGSVAVAGGYAAAQTLTTALNDEAYDPGNIDDQSTDRLLDPYQWDASFYASIAYAGSLPWSAEVNAYRRREFWDWYVEQAVPQAWKAVSDAPA